MFSPFSTPRGRRHLIHSRRRRKPCGIFTARLARGDEGFTAWVATWPTRQDHVGVSGRNWRALARLTKALPAIFPAGVLTRALNRPFIPPTPRLAVDSYWRAHPLRADRLARALAGRTGAPDDWTWRLADKRKDGLPATFRTPPAPYRERAFSRGAGFCCVCGQPVYRFGWHRDLWGAGPNKNATWHCGLRDRLAILECAERPCPLAQRVQARRCAESGARLWKTAEVDHRVPLFRVWRDHRQMSWPALLGFWGLPNLQVINRDVHVAKCATEAHDRSVARRSTTATTP